jgi:hypothetical protein
MAIPTEKQIPGRSRLRADLRMVTEALVAQLQAPTESPPPWNEFEWGIARAVVAIHGIAGILLRDLQWAEPAHWRDFLACQVAEIHDRQREFDSALREIDRLAIDAGIPVMILKGCALHALGIYQAGERPMADIDLLVRPGDAGMISGLLERAGFLLRGSSWKHREFQRVRGSERVSLDLHTLLSERLAGRPIELPDIAIGMEGSGLRGYATKAALMRHVLLHTAGNMSRRWVRAIHLHDIARLAGQLQPADWQELRSRGWLDRWCLYPPLCLAARYFTGAIDAETVAELAATCPRLLTRWAQRQILSDVSASNPSLLALPELAWCTSLGTLVRYLKMRVIPERELLEGLRGLTETADFAHGQSWFTMSHPKRIATWMFRRPIRPATLHAVRRGLGYEATSPDDPNTGTIRHP